VTMLMTNTSTNVCFAYGQRLVESVSESVLSGPDPSRDHLSVPKHGTTGVDGCCLRLENTSPDLVASLRGHDDQASQEPNFRRGDACIWPSVTDGPVHGSVRTMNGSTSPVNGNASQTGGSLARRTLPISPLHQSSSHD